MAIFVRSHYQDLLLMFLHRGFFAEAMSDNPLDPLQSPYGQSVLAAYSSACAVLDDTKSQYFNKPLLCARVWRIWSLAFSAAIIIGTVAIRGQHLNLEPPALEEFESGYTMFRSAAETSNRAARAMPILSIMLQKALRARELYRQRKEPVVLEAQLDDELFIFGGRTRLVSPPSPTPPDSPQSTTYKPLDPTRSYSAGSSSALNEPLTQPPETCLHSQATFADLSGGWNGLFHEVPQPSGVTCSSYNASNASMLDDRWSCFMHNYNI